MCFPCTPVRACVCPKYTAFCGDLKTSRVFSLRMRVGWQAAFPSLGSCFEHLCCWHPLLLYMPSLSHYTIARISSSSNSLLLCVFPSDEQGDGIFPISARGLICLQELDSFPLPNHGARGILFLPQYPWAISGPGTGLGLNNPLCSCPRFLRCLRSRPPSVFLSGPRCLAKSHWKDTTVLFIFTVANCLYVHHHLIFFLIKVHFHKLTLLFLFVCFFPSLFFSGFPSRYGRLILGYHCRTMAAE